MASRVHRGAAARSGELTWRRHHDDPGQQSGCGFLAALLGGCGGGNGSNAADKLPPTPSAPLISYGMSGDIELSTRTAANLTPTTTGGAADSWSVSPALAAGLAFNVSNGSISGTPVNASAPASYVVTATNPGGSGSGGTIRYFGYGAALGIAGSSARAAVATASGQTLIFNSTTWDLERTLLGTDSQVALSADGSVLAARASGTRLGLGVAADASVRVISLPSGTVINSWPYTTGAVPFAVDIALSGSGTMLGQVLVTNQNVPAYARQVGPAAGVAPVWSDSLASQQPIRLSADGTRIAVSSSKDSNAGTNIYHNAGLVTAVAGWAVGWTSNSEILQNIYGGDSVSASYLGSKLYDAAGVDLLAPSLPQLGRSGPVQAVGADSIYDPGTNQIYSVMTGTATAISSDVPNGVGAVAGASVMFESGSRLIVQPY